MTRSDRSACRCGGEDLLNLLNMAAGQSGSIGTVTLSHQPKRENTSSELVRDQRSQVRGQDRSLVPSRRWETGDTLHKDNAVYVFPYSG